MDTMGGARKNLDWIHLARDMDPCEHGYETTNCTGAGELIVQRNVISVSEEGICCTELGVFCFGI